MLRRNIDRITPEMMNLEGFHEKSPQKMKADQQKDLLAQQREKM
jgi:hypothetical protein